MTLSYNDLNLPNYINSAKAASIDVIKDGKEKQVYLTIPDIVKAQILSGLNALFISDTGKGKTRLARDVRDFYFNGAGDKGKAAWVQGRLEFEPRDFFERTYIDRSAQVYDSRTATQVDPDRIQRMLFVLDELNRVPTVKQSSFFDIGDGAYQDHRLGKEGYAVFMATANMNRNNGDFKGTSAIDRALLSRAHLVFDLDHRPFWPTPEDIAEMHAREANPKMRETEKRDISKDILEEYRGIVERSKVSNPALLAFSYMIGDYGLGFCQKDGDKFAFPVLCGDCDYSGKDLCARVKSSPPRTMEAVRLLSAGLEKVINLKEGTDVQIDAFDLALLAYRFTAYHGNLNDAMAQSEFRGRTQALMDKTVEELNARIAILRGYLPLIEQGKEPVLLRYEQNGQKIRTLENTGTEEMLRGLGISYETVNLGTELKTKGIGEDWINEFTKRYRA